MRTLIWFRSDLRVDDNPALTAATEAGDDGVAALFVVCMEQWRRHDWGATKIDFVMRSADQLAHKLSTLRIPMIFVKVDRFGEIADRIDRLTDEMGIELVFANREYEVNERRRDRDVEAAMAARGRSVCWYDDQAVVPPGRLRTKAGNPYSVYSPFRKAWVSYLETKGLPEPLPSPQRAVKFRGLDSTFLEALPLVPSAPEAATAALWPAGEKEAHHRLDLFVRDRLRPYASQRDVASLDATSRLSPYLAVGSISVRRCLQVALRENAGRLEGGSTGIDTWVGELVWRDFYRHVLVGFPRVSMRRAFRRETEDVRWRESDEDFASWCAGRTGIPFVDAGMRELLSTGFMHNRLRMVTAMFLTKDLLIDWRRGERFFMNHLVDADLANNNGGWQWSASTGTDAAPYFRIFNPWTQGKRYDADAKYIRQWIPELSGLPAADLHDPDRLAPHLEAIDYPPPIVSHKAARIRALSAFEEVKRMPAERSVE